MQHTIWIDALGYAAAVGTTLSWVPQLVKVMKHRSTKDISMGMFVIYATGVALWTVYGWLLHSWPMILCNSLTLVLALAIMILKLKFEAEYDSEIEKAEQ